MIIKNIVALVFVITFSSINICGDRFDNGGQSPSRFDSVPGRLDNSPDSSASDDEQSKRLFILATNIFASDSDKKYKSCTGDHFLSDEKVSAIPLAVAAHLINNGGQWAIKVPSKDSSGYTQYSYSIPIDNVPQGFLESQKSQKNNSPFYAIDNQGSLYKCEIPSESFLATYYKKYPNLTIGIASVATAVFIVGAWKCVGRVMDTNWIMVAVNRICGTNYNTKM